MKSPSGKQLSAVRSRLGLTQEGAAELIYVSRRAWQEWEGGRHAMPPGLWELFIIKVRALRGQRRVAVRDRPEPA